MQSDHPSKRMRIGTKSCAECRRRKVRCIFYGEDQHACKECILHDAQCVPQKPGQGSGKKRSEADVQQRIEELEGMVSHICKSIDLDIESVSMAEFKSSTGEALKRLRQTSSPENRGEEVASTIWTGSLNTSESGHDNGSIVTPEYLEDAPLINLFKDAMFIQRSTDQADGQQHDRYVNQRSKACIDALNGLLPKKEDMLAILENTQGYWGIWPVTPENLATGNNMGPVKDAISARNFILDSLKSGNPTKAAKAVLWFAFSILQLSAEFVRQRPLPSSQDFLVDSYMSGATNLLSIDEDLGCSIESLQCMILKANLFIDMGKPRKAWMCARHALNSSMLLGIHRVDANPGEVLLALWSQIWQLDRHLSLILGFPNSISESSPALAREHAGNNFIARLAHDLAIIAGHITERNQNHKDVDYSVTEQIENELKACRAAVPTEWWDAQTSPSTPLHEIYYREVAKFFYFGLHKTLHLPYMLKSSTNQNFEASRLLALEACRETMKAYQRLKVNASPKVVLCDLMDFQVFSSAVMMVLDLISENQRCMYQEVEDWGLVENVTQSLRSTASVMECTVAGQAAQLLEYLSMTQNGTYSGPEEYEAVIPYFGKVTIGKMKRGGAQSQSNTPNDFQLSDNYQLSNIVEFSANTFMPFNQELVPGYDYHDAELGIDWTSVYDENRNYDWTQAFEFKTSG